MDVPSLQVKLVSQAPVMLQEVVMLQRHPGPEAEVGEAEATTEPEGQALHGAVLLPPRQPPLPPRRASIPCQPMLGRDGIS